MQDLKQHGRLMDLMVLLGAGASVHCGIPTGVALVKCIVKEIENPSVKFHNALRRHFKKQKRDPDFEEFLIFLDLMKQFHTDVLLSLIEEIWPTESQKVTALKKDSRKLREEMIRELREVCLAFDSKKARNQYERFFQLGRQTRLQIFTTNYDPVLEDVLDDMEMDYSTNFSQIQKGRKTVFHWDSTLSALDSSNIQIAKLHGSVSWYQDKVTGDIEEISHPTTRSSDRNPVTHIMITPTVFKDVYQPPYYSLYDRFQETLKVAKFIIVVGHSLRDEWLYGAIVEHLDKGGIVAYVGRRRRAEISDRIKKIAEHKGFIYVPMSSNLFMPMLAQFVVDSRYQTAQLEESLRKAGKNAETALAKKVVASLKVPNKVMRPNEKIKVQLSFQGTLIKGFYRLTLLDSLENAILVKDVMRDESGVGTLSGYSSRSRTVTIRIPSETDNETDHIVFRFEAINQTSPGDEEVQKIVVTKDIKRRINWEFRD